MRDWPAAHAAAIAWQAVKAGDPLFQQQKHPQYGDVDGVPFEGVSSLTSAAPPSRSCWKNSGAA
ncbi:hypothetical protein [Streptomyces sp. NPDC001714]|uniref:hypothetical protein n=1 Tax=Streptomyces sp. NPDC001714 TaxID=3364603 RepID=UPI0036804835